MITGIGIDLIEIARVERAFERFGDRYRNRIFTPEEQVFCDSFRKPIERFAARWSAKEAAVKALGTGFTRGVRWVDIAVLPNELGQPLLHLVGRAAEIAHEQGVRAAHVSLSHGRDHATAIVVLSNSPSEGPLVRFDPFSEVTEG